MSADKTHPASPSKAHPLNVDAFIREFADHTNRGHTKRFCFLLGAGASKSSGISLGSELAMEWLREIHKREAEADQPFEEWTTADNLRIEGFDLENAASFYTRIFERLFDGEMDTGQFWLEQKFATATPSPGYYFLGQILHGSPHRIVVTTNFDNLAADTVLQLTGNLPRIISDARIARFLSTQPRLPIIAKVHGDIGFAATKNTTDGVAKLDAEWKVPLQRIFSLYTPIIIGWEGNDGSLMDFLTKEMVDTDGHSLLPYGIYWCYRSDKKWQQRLAQNPKLQALAGKHAIRFIPIEGFDELLRKLAESLSLPNPLIQLKEQQEKRLKVFGDNLRVEADQTPRKKDSDDIRAMVEVFEASQEKDPVRRAGKMRAVVEKYPENAMTHAAFAAELHSQKRNDEEAEQHYIEAIRLNPNDADTLGNYADFLADQRKDYERAEEYYQQTLAADPNDATTLGNYAHFLADQRKDYERAEEYYQKALAADPNDANNLSNYALFLENQRKDYGRAEEYYQQALTADPNHANNLGNYAVFLKDQRQNYDRAEEYYQKALATDPYHANNLCNYANFLKNQRKDYERAEEYYQKALVADPAQASHLGNYALFLEHQRKDYDRAEEYYQKALAADPNDINILSYYALFLADQRMDYDRAEECYQKALAADPARANILGGYAVFLSSQRKDYERAEEYYQKALAADPNDATTLDNYASFLADQRENFDRADEYYQKALAADPNDATTLDNYAIFLADQRGDYERAEEYYQKALAADPNDAIILDNYATFLANQRKDLERAKEYQQKAREVRNLAAAP